jgi:hypothetical protein
MPRKMPKNWAYVISSGFFASEKRMKKNTPMGVIA